MAGSRDLLQCVWFVKDQNHKSSHCYSSLLLYPPFYSFGGVQRRRRQLRQKLCGRNQGYLQTERKREQNYMRRIEWRSFLLEWCILLSLQRIRTFCRPNVEYTGRLMNAKALQIIAFKWVIHLPSHHTADVRISHYLVSITPTAEE